MDFTDLRKAYLDRIWRSKWDLTDWKSAMFLVLTPVPFLVLRNSKVLLVTPCSCFCSRIRLTADDRIIGGGLPDLAGSAASCDPARRIRRRKGTS
jgi:hypothetical protein